jgi:hypothetical protein
MDSFWIINQREYRLYSICLAILNSSYFIFKFYRDSANGICCNNRLDCVKYGFVFLLKICLTASSNKWRDARWQEFIAYSLLKLKIFGLSIRRCRLDVSIIIEKSNPRCYRSHLCVRIFVFEKIFIICLTDFLR